MNRHFEQVKKFHLAAGEPMASEPTMLDRGNDSLMEYYISQLKGVTSSMRIDKDGGDLYFRTSLALEEIIETMEATTLEKQVDGIIDAIYILLGTLTKMGVKPEKIFDIVAGANIAKILPDGTVLRDPETGKIMKPPGWEETYAPEPHIIAELERQRRTANCKTCNGTSETIWGLGCPGCC